MKEGSGAPQKRSKIAPPSVPPPEALYDLVFFFVFCRGAALRDWKILDGPAIRNAIWGDSREFIRANRFAEKSLLSQRASDWREPAIRNS